MSSKRGQIWTTDLTSGAVILATVLLLFILSWNDLAVRWNSSNQYRQMLTDAIMASEALMTSPGEPGSWEMLPDISNASAIGLVNGRNELSDMKLARLKGEENSTYRFVKERLGVQRYELGIRITDLDGEDGYYEYGRFPSGLNDSVVLERLGIMNGTMVVVHVEVWR